MPPQQQGVPHPRVESAVVRDYLTHLAVHQRVSASTQNQAFCAILFLCREVLGLNVESVSPGVRAKRGERLPVVLSMPETVALLGAMSGRIIVFTNVRNSIFSRRDFSDCRRSFQRPDSGSHSASHAFNVHAREPISM